MHRIAALVLIAVAALAADRFQPLSVRQVKVQGEIGRRIDITVRNNLMALDADKDFLAPFRTKTAKDGYIGLGKLILSAVRMAAYTGDADVTALKNRLLSAVIGSQETDGYIGFFTPAQRVRALWDVHEIGYLIYALLADYELFENQRSLDSAKRAADYVMAHWREIPPDWGDRTGVATHVAVTGIERTFLALHRATGDPRLLNFVLRERRLPEWDFPIVIGRRAGIEGHIYAYMARSLAQLELYRTQSDAALLRSSDRAVLFLTVSNGAAITGGAGQWEIWTNDQDGRGALAETCATAYQIRVYESLLRMRGEARYGDMMERTIYNTLFAAQSPDGRRIRYYSPIEGPREYHPGDTYCCPGNYRRIISELPEMIYYAAGNGAAVNLFAPSEATIGTVRLRQETDYPASGKVTVRVDPRSPGRFPLLLRIPAWASGARVSVNGQPVAGSTPGAFATIDREWKPGDRVDLDLPMQFRLVRGRERQSGRAAVMRGPLVFCLNPSQSKALDTQDAADLGRHIIDPTSFEVVRDDSVHPGGIACKAGLWKPGYGTGSKHDLEVMLTEFADPGGRAMYFRLRDPASAVPDELFGR